ncbi:cytochrome b/b6 domain-containing protein [Tianweitania sp. BSSL-BM11]|uniref:Cytochrome b/b6 domain-containing protein n=1 Tax=Tianweitania aestuarii TaxID=2814886 RepID=A0ABS5RRI2_9HYPH|nr:cytochrome b/b6 domain-containing protein [Tianweitania aestuarii]MBS9719572.1 cytochrome b/b6 domain-containing protein [Tianweitania aestuarii]
MIRARTYYVWDPLQRLFHWCLAISFILSVFVSGHQHPHLHRWVGCVTVLLILFRLVYGAAGPHYARFSQLLRGTKETLTYIRGLRHGRATRYLGHSPLSGLFALLMLAGMAVLSLSGWLLGAPGENGSAALLVFHRSIAVSMIALVLFHVCAVLWASLWRRENLALAMLTGRKRQPERGDVL